MKTCPQCNAMNPDNQKFCLNCSEDLENIDDIGAAETEDNATYSAGYKPGDLKFVVKKGILPEMAYLLDEPNMTIGRHDDESRFYPDIDLYYQENEGEWTVSRQHARTAIKDGELYICDLESENGTYINTPDRISPHREYQLKPGDVIAVGQNIVLKIKEHY